MISTDVYRLRIGLFGGGKHVRRKKVASANVEGTWEDNVIVLLYLLGPLIVIGSFWCAVDTNSIAFSPDSRGTIGPRVKETWATSAEIGNRSTRHDVRAGLGPVSNRSKVEASYDARRFLQRHNT